MFVVATDMDRTLLPNGKQKQDGSMKVFKRIIKEKKLPLVFVTGRRLSLLKKAVAKYKTPLPKYAICDVGTTVYNIQKGKYVKDTNYAKHIRAITPKWNVKKFKKTLSTINELKIQEKATQNEFKLSYYIYELKNASKTVKKVTKAISKTCKAATIVYSVDETSKTGLLDILPKKATKVGALEYLRKKLRLGKKKVVYCGDSGNDILPLTFGYSAILVRNAIPEVKKAIKKITKNRKVNIYIARGYKKLNGYYTSGIIEGLIKRGLIDKKYAK